jgi:DNA topoisomerase-1
MLFDGYTKLTGAAKRDMDKEHIPPLTEGEKLDVRKITPSQHFTKPPQRYTQASLIKTLEQEGIGRPSTYATILTTIQTRNYVGLRNGSFYATLLGKTVTEKLDRYFIEIMDVAFTARMEKNLDDIAEAKKDWIDVLKEFYKSFEMNLLTARRNMKSTRGEEAERTEHKCEKCGRTMVIRWGPSGPFLGCEGYLDDDNKCSFTIPLNDDGTIMEDLSGPVKDGRYEESPIHLKLGRYGYYLETESGVRARIPKGFKIEELNPETAVKLFEESKQEEKLMGQLDDGAQVFLKRGRYGPYLQVVTGKDK